MNMNNNVDSQLITVAKRIVKDGRRKQERNAVCISLFGITLRSNLADGFPIATAKFTPFKSIRNEFIAMINGVTNANKMGSSIWDQWGLSKDHTRTVAKSGEEIITAAVTVLGLELADYIVKATAAIEAGEVTLELINVGTGELTTATQTLTPETPVNVLAHSLLHHDAAQQTNNWVFDSGVDKTDLVAISTVIAAKLSGRDVGECLATIRKHCEDNGLTDESPEHAYTDAFEQYFPDTITTKHILKEEGYLGPVYGAVWRGLVDGVDQLADLEQQIRKGGDRRMVIAGWLPQILPDPELTQDENILAGKQVLPPCHVTYVFDLYDGVLNLEMLQRSGDWLIGVPFNHAALGLWVESLSHVHGLTPGEIKHDITNAHIYDNQLEVIDFEDYIESETYALPRVKFLADGSNPDDPSAPKSITNLKREDIVLVDYMSGDAIKLPVTA